MQARNGGIEDASREQAGEEARIVPMRLQKFLARAGVASRRGSEDLMTAGRVTVNGSVVRELGSKVDPAIDVVEVDGKRVSLSDGSAYLVLNKPENVITTMDDPQGRPTVVPYVPVDRFPGLFPVGRLDRDTTGVLLFMTDGELAAKLLHPSSLVKKTYHAVVKGYVYDDELDPLREGIELDDGVCAPARVEIVSADDAYDVTLGRLAPDETALEITITEGKKREVKRMMSAIHHPVVELNRVSFGPITARGLEPGAWRLLTKEEIDELKAIVSGVSRDGLRPEATGEA
jgi:23S rRNA pseudouridine2605 synthase